MSNNTHKDSSGQTYTSPDGKPAQSGTSVQINTSNGQVSGKMIGGYVVKDK